MSNSKGDNQQLDYGALKTLHVRQISANCHITAGDYDNDLNKDTIASNQSFNKNITKRLEAWKRVELLIYLVLVLLTDINSSPLLPPSLLTTGGEKSGQDTPRYLI